jgi:phosphoenolpyruvate synthase/pyruvate phosphate dikinase
MTRTLGIVPLTAQEATHSYLVGNKAAQLASLIARGYDVPPGVVITDRIDGFDAGVDGLIESLRENAVVPPWAVRSSGTAEDSARAAFPGIFVSVLGVSDARSLADAVHRVRASLTAERAVTYARGRDLNLASCRMAVLVQSLVNAAVSGVAFSRDPVTMESTVGVEASWGLGEPVVSGEVTPDSWTVAGGTITARRTGTKRFGLFLRDGTIVRQATANGLRAQPCLTDSEVLRISAMTRRLEDDLAAPQDVEWALTQDGTLKLLQARPITTGATT